MKILQKLIGLVLVAGALIAQAAQAQQYATGTLVTNLDLVAATTSNTTATVACTKYEEVGLDISFNAMAAGASNVVFTLARSVDGSNYDVESNISITLAQNGTSTVRYLTNIYMGSLGYLKLKSFASPTSLVACTNVCVRYSLKPTRSGK